MAFIYDIDGQRIAETPGTGSRTLLLRDLFEWVPVTGTALRAWTPPPGPWLPPEDLLPLLGLLGASGLLVLLARLGALSAANERPGPAFLVTILSVQLAAPQAALAGGGGGPTIVRRWIVTDHLGTATLVVSGGGAAVDRRLFDPNGLVLQEESTETSTQLFTGKRYQAAAGLYDFDARWYDAAAGRFASVDPVLHLADPQTHNPYGSVRNNPLRFVDSDGRDFGGVGSGTGSQGETGNPVVNNAFEALQHYFPGNGEPAELVPDVQDAIINSRDQQYGSDRIRTGRTLTLDGGVYGVDVEPDRALITFEGSTRAPLRPRLIELSQPGGIDALHEDPSWASVDHGSCLYGGFGVARALVAAGLAGLAIAGWRMRPRRR